MKLYLIPVALMFFCLGRISNAQESIDKRIIEAFGEKDANFLQANNPTMLAYYTYILDNGFIVSNYGKEKVLANSSTIQLLILKPAFQSETKPNLENGISSINILKYEFSLDPDKKRLYRLDDSGWVIIMLSANEINRNMNNSSESK